MTITPQMAAALVKFQSTVPKIDLSTEVSIPTKSGRDIKFNYATLANIMSQIREPMKDAGLAFSQVLGDGTLSTILMCAEDGSTIVSTMPLKIEGDPKHIGQMITYFKRYSLAAILGIAGEDDKDAGNLVGVSIRGDKRKMSRELLEKALERVAGGEDGVLEMAEEHFELTEDQREAIKKAYGVPG